MAMQYVALLRGINVGGRNSVPMAGLRQLAESAGWGDPRTYIQSGNLVFLADDAPADLESRLEDEIRQQYGVSSAVIVRSEGDWRTYLKSNPFEQESAATPAFVHLALSKAPLRSGAAEEIEKRGQHAERVVAAAGALWIHSPAGTGRSKLTPAILAREAGSPVTSRNWSTVRKIGAMLGVNAEH